MVLCDVQNRPVLQAICFCNSRRFGVKHFLVNTTYQLISSFSLAVKSLKGDHLSRAIGRIAGSGGKTKFTIENVTKTRIILANSKVHILGSFQNIKIARTAICNLILGECCDAQFMYCIKSVTS